MSYPDFITFGNGNMIAREAIVAIMTEANSGPGKKQGQIVLKTGACIGVTSADAKRISTALQNTVNTMMAADDVEPENKEALHGAN